MKILIGHWGHEANTFAEKMSTYEAYTSRGAFFGEESIQANEGVPSYLGGIIAAGREEGVELIPTCAHTAAAPTLDQECVEKMLSAILPVCKAHKDEIDGICIALHGAGVAAEIDDLESYVLRKIREIVGPDIPITVPMDLHGNVSQEMADLANGLFGIRKYPHLDKFDASYLAMKTLIRIIRGEVETETAVEHIPLLIPISAGLTANEPFPSIEQHFREYIRTHGLIEASFFHGFPYADVPCSSASVVVVAPKGGKTSAREAAHDLASYLWSRHEEFKAEILTPAQAFDRAELVEDPGYVVINDASDNPGGGTPGDGTHLLREMLRRNRPKSIFGFIVDREAVEKIFSCGVGGTLSLTLGGKTEKIYGAPLELKDAYVCCLSDGNFIHTSPNLYGLASKLGKCARIRVGNVDIVVGCARNQTFDDRPFLVTGADITQYRYVGLKSTQHFRSFFGSRAAKIITTDPPGLNTADLSIFDYRKIVRPIYPLDENVSYE